MFEVLLLEISGGGTREGCVPPSSPGWKEEEELSCSTDRGDNRQCSGQRSSFQGGMPSCEGLRLAVEVGSVWGVRCVHWGRWRECEGEVGVLPRPPSPPCFQLPVDEA